MSGVAELVRVGKGETSIPVGVIIRVAKRQDIELAATIAGELLVFARGRLAKAALPALITERDAQMASFAPVLEGALVEYFDEMLARAGVKKDVAFPLDPDAIDWKVEARILEEILAIFYIELGSLAFAAAGSELGIELTFSLKSPISAAIRDRLATQVTLISDNTRDILRNKVQAAVRDGVSIDDLVRGSDSEPGLRALFGTRARTIALTETATAYNTASLTAYQASGLIDDVTVFDGPDCGWLTHDDPDLAHGSTRSLEEAFAHTTSHPHCQRAFGAVVAR